MERHLVILKTVEKIKMGCGCSGGGERKKSLTESKNNKNTKNFSSGASRPVKTTTPSRGGSEDENWYIKDVSIDEIIEIWEERIVFQNFSMPEGLKDKVYLKK